ncbi:hypothetical protein F0170_09900 [Pseudomonas sp. MAFF 730085]|uniref:Uncharacterized protein n=1 Tax=Pseudomonas kitaguniensis TaxID=2607908 RepID=A0A5N7JSA6_9PSED|nr:hypothetical protein [Pseudomonas kitaguniensis]MPQ84269.1 hypothetical protein [Pseudomonas kitaguniensis]
MIFLEGDWRIVDRQASLLQRKPHTLGVNREKTSNTAMKSLSVTNATTLLKGTYNELTAE